jgi:hypothetical protein
MCLDCYAPMADQACAGLTPAEAARLHAWLGTSLRLTCLPDAGAAPDATGAHEEGGTP